MSYKTPLMIKSPHLMTNLKRIRGAVSDRSFFKDSFFFSHELINYNNDIRISRLVYAGQVHREVSYRMEVLKAIIFLCAPRQPMDSFRLEINAASLSQT